ncbi:hypothetical protein TRVL_08153 [Trypanosoma vivax]|nr:hypothetical protein TRVL_08153 [Trypanosoma vivax]
MFRHRVPQQLSAVALPSANRMRSCDRLLRHVRAFRVYGRSRFACGSHRPLVHRVSFIGRAPWALLLIGPLVHGAEFAGPEPSGRIFICRLGNLTQAVAMKSQCPRRF